MGQLIGLHQDPGESVPPFEAEIRRRLWWHVCGLESRGAEEGGSRLTSVMEDSHVRLPSNYFDYDLDPKMIELPHPRTGFTDMFFALVRWETMLLVHNLWAIRKKHNSENQGTVANDVKLKQTKALAESKSRLDTSYLKYLHDSRPYDWLCTKFAEAILVR